jgi:hypothetical protein
MLKRPQFTAALAIAVTFALAGCASKSHQLQAAHVSTTGYKKLECKELHAELQGNINRTNELTGILDKKASDDEAAMAIGMILFWPALFALEGGDKEEAAEYSRLKGEINAMEQVAILNDCSDVIEVVKDYKDAEQLARLEREKLKTQTQAMGTNPN